jgi:hypothetical protein
MPRLTSMRTLTTVLSAAALFAVAGCGSQGVATPTTPPLPHPDPAKYKVTDLVHPGNDEHPLALAQGKPHPRGGYQWHLFTRVPGQGTVEVTHDGQPLLPFVSTDGGGSPMTATCTKSGQVAVYTAQPHQPPGVVLAWDVTRTTYALHGSTATQVSSKVVRKAAADPTLRKQMPQLFHPTRLFAGCQGGFQ